MGVRRLPAGQGEVEGVWLDHHVLFRMALCLHLLISLHKVQRNVGGRAGEKGGCKRQGAESRCMSPSMCIIFPTGENMLFYSCGLLELTLLLV